MPQIRVSFIWPFLLLGAAWSLVISVSLAWNLHHHVGTQFDIMRQVARASAEKDVLYRQWNVLHGGVYVEATPQHLPDAHLGHVADRDLETASGVRLTLVTAPAMLEEVYLAAPEKGLAQAEIKSLSPLYPRNEPDGWERTALRALADGAGEYYGLTEKNGAPYMRMMLPLLAGQGCLKNRETVEGIQAGDLIGGVSVSVSASPFLDAAARHRRMMMAGHALIWFFGLFGGYGAFHFLRQEIVARGLAEDEAHRLRKQNEMILNSAGEGILGVDVRGRHTFVNPRAADMLGYSVAELTGNPHNSHAIWHHSYADGSPYPETVCPIYNSFIEGRVSRSDTDVFWHRDGHCFPVEFISTPIRGVDGSIQGAVVTFSDITMRKRAEESLRENEEHLRAIFSQAAVGIAQVAIDGQWLRVNDRLCQLLGYGSQELLGMDFSQFTHPDDLAKDRALLAELVAGRIQTYTREKRYIRKDGKPVWASVSVSLVRDDAGQPLYFVSIVADISERRAAEEAQRNLLQQLVQSQKMESVGRLAGGVAHDFNNLLTVIDGYCLLARRELPETGRTADYIDNIHQASRRAASLTRQLLAFSRKQVLVTQVVSVKELVTAMTKMLIRLIGEDVSLEVHCEDVSSVVADPGQIEQIVMNLAVNARDAMPGGGLLCIETDEQEYPALDPQAGGESLPSRRYVRLRVRDSGVGMAPDLLPRIFEPFFTTKESDKGTGLGLSTVYGIVAQHNGFIDVTSSPGGGTQFTILLPVTDRQQEKKKSESAASMSRGSETLLLVEDDTLVRAVLVETLGALGYQLLVAANGEEAERLEEQHTGDIDLLVTDVVMPGINGVDLARRLHRRRPQMKILCISGYPGDPHLQEAFGCDSEFFLSKPFSMSDFVARVRHILDG